MIKKFAAFLILFISIVGFTKAQITFTENDTTKVKLKSYPDFIDEEVLYVLKSDDQYQEVMVSKDQDISKYIEVSDIQSISVLKDKSAINIYGLRAEHGVIVIEFKKGKFKRLQKDLNGRLLDGK